MRSVYVSAGDFRSREHVLYFFGRTALSSAVKCDSSVAHVPIFVRGATEKSHEEGMRELAIGVHDDDNDISPILVPNFP
jgi:hypothetical protein